MVLTFCAPGPLTPLDLLRLWTSSALAPFKAPVGAGDWVQVLAGRSFANSFAKFFAEATPLQALKICRGDAVASSGGIVHECVRGWPCRPFAAFPLRECLGPMNIHRGTVPQPLPAEPDMAPLPDDGGIDLRAIVGLLWRGKWIIAICMAVGLGLGLLAVSQLEPTYRASAKVLFQPEQTSAANLQELLSRQGVSRNALENEIQILTSTNHIARVVEALNLSRYPEFNPALRTEAPTPLERLRGLLNWRTYISPAFLADLGLADPPVTPRTDPAEAARRLQLGIIAAVQNGLQLDPIENSRVIEIGFEGGDRRLVAQIVNTVAQEYIDEQLETKMAATRQATVWLADRVDELAERVRQAELAVEEARTEVAQNAGQSAAITRQQLEAINSALAAARTEFAGIETRYLNVSAVLADPDADLGTVTLFRNAEVIRRLRGEESSLVSRDARLETFARDNPQRIQIQVALANVRGGMRREAERIAAALQADVEEARARVTALEEEVRKLEATEREQRRGEITLRQLEREAQASRTLYENFLARLEENTQQEGLQTADARILTPAEVPGGPLATTKNRTLMIALVLGGAAGVGAVFLLDRLNNTFRGVDQLQSMTGLPVLASLPAVGSKVARAEVVANLREKPNGLLAEAVRNMRTSVLFGTGGASPKVVAFTSSVPREGKSTTAFLMALTSQQMGRSAIIVDCDLRLHALSSLVRQDEEKPGLLSVVQGNAGVAEALLIDEDTGLHILTAQPAERHDAPSAADTVSSEGFARLVRQLSETYDLVILDTPPVLVVTDPRIIARLADAIVYAVRWDETPRGAVLEGLREMASVSAPLAGLVLTMVDNQKASSYAYEGYGYYRSRYTDYYTS